MRKEILFIIEEFDLGGINAFECIKQIKEQLNNQKLTRTKKN
jgi:hypothetical protein